MDGWPPGAAKNEIPLGCSGQGQKKGAPHPLRCKCGYPQRDHIYGDCTGNVICPIDRDRQDVDHSKSGAGERNRNSRPSTVRRS